MNIIDIPRWFFRILLTGIVLVGLCRGLAAQQAGSASAAVVKAVPADVYRPTVLPGRIVLTWSDDPATTQSVTWRTSTEVVQGLAEITIADAGPTFDQATTRSVAVTESLTTDLSKAHYHSVTFTGLTPKTVYAYRVGDGKNWSEWFQFRTAASTPDPFSFIYFGDAQNDLRSKWSRVVREAWRTAPKAAFMIHAGDLINRAESDQEWGEWFGAGAWMNAMVPNLPIPGNHEQARTSGETSGLSHHWRPSFTLPMNGPAGLEESCFTLVYQGVRLIGMNSNEKHAEQAAWLDKVLTENTEKWVICTFHHPIFSTAKLRDNRELREIWKPILDKHRVDLVLQGHDHTYGRTGLETPVATANLSTGFNTKDAFSGTVYVVSVSGPKMYNVQRSPFMPRVAEDTQLYQIIHLDGDRLSYEAYTATGELYDAFLLTHHADGSRTLTEQVPDTPERLRPPVLKEPEKKASEALK